MQRLPTSTAAVFTRSAAITLLALAAPAALAQPWTVTRLQTPSDWANARAFGAGDWQQVGAADVFDSFYQALMPNAVLWTQSGAVVDLHPAGANGPSQANGTSNGRQIGWAIMGEPHAIMWSGSAASRVDLQPIAPNVRYSWGTGISADQQVGYAEVQDPDYSTHLHASLWTDTAASWVDLNPAGASQSRAYGVSNGRQIGVATIGGAEHASLWAGTAASWIDLNPPGASSSSANATGFGSTAGSVTIGGVTHASSWLGSSSSWTDLHPAGATSSVATGVFYSNIGGYAMYGATSHAMYFGGWFGALDLQSLLPPEFTESTANGLWADLDNVYIVGTAFNSLTGQGEAIMWSVPAPSVTVLLGISGLLLTRRRR